jgi:hypothetical protein
LFLEHKTPCNIKWILLQFSKVCFWS